MKTTTKIKRYQTRMEANIHAMLSAIAFGRVELAGTCAEMAAHYANAIRSTVDVQNNILTR